MFGRVKTGVPNKLGINYKREGNLKRHIKVRIVTTVKKWLPLVTAGEIGKKFLSECSKWYM